MRMLAAILFVFSNGCTLAFGSQTDSLQHVLQSAPPDTTRVLLLGQLTEAYLASDPVHAKHLADEGLALARKLNFGRGILIILNHLIDYYYRQSDYVSAIEYGMESLKIAHQLGDSLAMANAYRNLGNTNTFGLKRYDQAIQYHEAALQLYLRHKDSLHIAAEDGSITWIYAITHQNLKDALMMADQGITIARALGNDQILSYNYNSEGLIYLEQGLYDSAFTYITKSIDAAKLANDQAVIAYNKSIIGDIYVKHRRYADAIEEYRQSAKESQRLHIREIYKESLRGLANCYEALHQYKEAYQYYTSYIGLRDSLLNWETTQKTLLLQKQFEEQQKESRIKQLESDKAAIVQENRMYIIIFVVGIVSLLGIISLIVRNSHMRKLAHEQLQQKNEEIETQNEELLQSKEEIAAQRDIVEEQNRNLTKLNDTKDKLFSIIGHDLRGPLASLKSLLGLAANEQFSVDELKAFMPKINQNVGTLHEMMENLLRWANAQMGGLKSNPVSVKLHTLCETEIQLFEESLKEKEIQVTNSVPDDVSVFADVDHVRIIMRNLINNAIKFTQTKGALLINARREGDWVEIAVADTGIGIPADRINTLFEIQSKASYTSQGTRGEKGTGLGLLLCKEMVEANGGSIRVASVEGQGSTFYVVLRS